MSRFCCSLFCFVAFAFYVILSQQPVLHSGAYSLVRSLLRRKAGVVEAMMQASWSATVFGSGAYGGNVSKCDEGESVDWPKKRASTMRPLLSQTLYAAQVKVKDTARNSL